MGIRLNEPRRRPAHAGRTWAEVVHERPRLTARGLRALGRPVPESVDDDELIVLTVKESSQ